METCGRMCDLPGYSTQSLPIIPEPHTIICDELFVLSFFLHFLNRCYGNLDKTPSLISSNEQAIEGEIRTLIEIEKTPHRYFSVHVFYRSSAKVTLYL